MKCENTIELVVDSFLENLDPDTARRLDEHLQSCSACGEEAAELRRLWDDLGRLPAPAARQEAAVRFGRRLAASRTAFGRPALTAAAAVILLLAGAALGRLLPISRPDESTAVATPDARRFLLLIRGDEPERRAPEAQLVREYGEWAGQLGAAGRLIAAQKLEDDGGRWVRGSDESADVVSGYFLISAADYDEADSIARASPHIGYGGTIEVRAVDRR